MKVVSIFIDNKNRHWIALESNTTGKGLSLMIREGQYKKLLAASKWRGNYNPTHEKEIWYPEIPAQYP
jgi:hypothetical protein